MCRTNGMGVNGEDGVYLDITEFGKRDPEGLERKLGGVLEIYRKFKGTDPAKEPMIIFPAVHYSMGGLWVDYEATPDNTLDPKSPRNQMTNIPGLYAAGECEYQYHGANRLGANSLLSCIFGGFVAAPAMQLYTKNLTHGHSDVPQSVYDRARTQWESRFEQIRAMKGSVNPYKLGAELGDQMTGYCTVVRENDKLEALVENIKGWKHDWKNLNVLDTGNSGNQAIFFANHLYNMLELAHVIAQGALNRNESRGAHYKPEFPNRDDANWLKTTMARYSPNGPELSYVPVATPVVKPRERKYTGS